MPRPQADPTPLRRGLALERRYQGDRPAILTRESGSDAPPARTIRGHAAVFNTWSTLYESKYYRWREIIRPGAFATAIREKQDVFCLLNHNPDWVVGRSTSGTCRLAEDDQGLAFDCDPNPESQLIHDLVVAPMARQDLDRCSFAFLVRSGGEKITIREEDDVLIEERELTDLDLYDVSVVTYPQYHEAMCELASLGERRQAALLDQVAARERQRIRQARARALKLWI